MPIKSPKGGNKMRKKGIKMLSFLLALALVITMASTGFVFSASAETYNDFEYEVLENGTIEITEFNGSTADLIIPSEINGKTVSSIGDYAFAGIITLNSVTIPATVTELGYVPFFECSSLTQFIVDEQNENFASFNGAVYNKSLSKLVAYPAGLSTFDSTAVPSNLTEIGQSAFAGCILLTEITIPQTVTTVGNFAFGDCKALESITIGSRVSQIAAIGECISLTQFIVDENNNYYSTVDGVLYDKYQKTLVSFPGGLTSFSQVRTPSTLKIIGDYAFLECTKLKEIVLPHEISHIGYYAFHACTSLEKIVIPKSLSTIQEGAFSYCTSLKNINITKNVWHIGAEAFYNCISLESIEIAGLNRICTGTFESCISLKKVVLPPVPEYIGNYAFFNCTSLTDIQINYVQDLIGECAFLNCTNLKSVYIPQGVKKIGGYAFGFDYDFDNNDIIQKNDFIVYGEKNGIAKQYADAYGFKFAQPAPWEIKLNKSTMTIGAGESFTLKKTVTPECSVSKYTWSSSDKNIASVDSNGKVTGKKAGTATITVKSANGKKASCKVTVKPAPTGVKLSHTTLYVGQYEKTTLKAIITGGYCASDFTWSSSNPNAVKVTRNGFDGKLETQFYGSSTITFKTYNGKTASCDVYICPSPDDAKLNKTSITLGSGEKYKLKASVKGTCTGESCKWTTSESSVASVKNNGFEGIVEAKDVGTSEIEFKTYNFKSATCKVTVKHAPTGVNLNKTSLTLGKDEKFTLKAKIVGGVCGNDFSWSSSNPSVATVTRCGFDGKIVAKKPGTTTITFKTYNGKTATCKITVKSAPTGVRLNKTNLTLGNGEKFTLKASIVGGACGNDFSWSSSNSSVATVTRCGYDGKIVAKKPGTTTITFKTYNGKTATCKITVKPAPTGVKLNKTNLTLGNDEKFTLKASLTGGTCASDFTWTSSDSSVVSVTRNGYDGKLVANGEGEATITFKTYNGKTATCKVTVGPAPTEVKLNKTNLSLKSGDKFTLKASILGGVCGNDFTWSSSDPNVATVTRWGYDGKIVAKKRGTTVITFKTYNGKTAVCEVVVE